MIRVTRPRHETQCCYNSPWWLIVAVTRADSKHLSVIYKPPSSSHKESLVSSFKAWHSFFSFSVYLAGRWCTRAPRCSPSTPWSSGWTRTPGSSGWTRRNWHETRVQGHDPTCPSLRRHAAPPSHSLYGHSPPPRGIVFWLVSNQMSVSGPGLAVIDILH